MTGKCRIIVACDVQITGKCGRGSAKSAPGTLKKAFWGNDREVRLFDLEVRFR